MNRSQADYDMLKKNLELLSENELMIAMVLYLKDIKDLLVPISMEAEEHLQAKKVDKKYV